MLARSTLRCLRTTSPRFVISARPTSTLSTPAFTSFFSPNDRWSNAPLRRNNATHALLATTTSEISPPSPHAVGTFKPTPALTAGQLFKIYSQLSKARLTTVVVLTAMAGVALSPLPTTVPVLLSTAAGTALCSASANALNQVQEVPLDAQMARTRLRPIVRRAISPLHATGFAAVSGIAGTALLWTMAGPTTAVLGAANIALYAGVYTWMKRKSTWNTPVGAVVGALPPLMGWTACGGQLLPSASYPAHYFLPSFLSSADSAASTAAEALALVDNPLSPFALFMLLYSWQYPHFNSLAHIMRGSYAQAGYKMMSVVNPPKNREISLRHALLLLPISSILIPLSGLTTWAFALTSLPVNLFLARGAWRFWRSGTEKDARSIWHASLWYMPVILALMMMHKQSLRWGELLGLESPIVNENKTREEGSEAVAEE